MNRIVRATDVVNFVMKNGEFRPLLVVRAWDLTPPVTAAPPTVAPRAGEQVKFPAHNQPSQVAIAHISGLLLIDPLVDQKNVPIQAPVMVPARTLPARPADPLSPSNATLEDQVRAGNASSATPAERATGAAAQKELYRRGALPAGTHTPAGGLDFRNRGTAGTTPVGTTAPVATDFAALQAAVTLGNQPNATPAQIQAGKDAAAELAKGPAAPVALPEVDTGNDCSVWIAAAAYDEAHAVGTWHWPKG
jgi:hypothetical protein